MYLPKQFDGNSVKNYRFFCFSWNEKPVPHTGFKYNELNRCFFFKFISDLSKALQPYAITIFPRSFRITQLRRTKKKQTNKQTKQQRKMETNRRTIISQTNVPTACDWLSGRVKKKMWVIWCAISKGVPNFPKQKRSDSDSIFHVYGNDLFKFYPRLRYLLYPINNSIIFFDDVQISQ